MQFDAVCQSRKCNYMAKKIAMLFPYAPSYREAIYKLMDKELDGVQMRQAVEKLVGEHDFKGFCTKASRKKSTVRNLYDITITEDENRICLTFYGSGFLYNMVRILTGTLVEIGMGERTVESIDEVFTKKERALAGVTAPAKGLTLVRVLYD